MRRLLAAAVTVLVALVVAPAVEAGGQCGTHPWCDTKLSPDRRATLLIGALTPAERIGLLAGDHGEGIVGLPTSHTGDADGVPRVGLPPLHLSDGPVGVRQGPSTALPSTMALAASFDRGTAALAARVVADEAKLKGNDIVYAPTVNVLRTPLWGRVFESYGEDPALTTDLSVAYIRALQRAGVMADVKHFAANDQEGAGPTGAIGSRYSVDARVGERTLRELVLAPFEAAVERAHVATIMCSYNRLNGPHACESRPLLTGILRREWGFRGFVIADYGASKHVGTGLAAGLDFEPWPYADLDGGENLTPPTIEQALARGQTTQAAVDRAGHHLLRTLFAYGFFDRAAYANDPSRIDFAAHARVAGTVEERGITLLKNNGALPLKRSRLHALAIIGADAERYTRGGGSSDVAPRSLVTARQGIERRAGAGVTVRYDPGTSLDSAARAAAGADAAIVVVADTAAEGQDKPCLGLDCGSADALKRDALIERVAAANPHTIVVLETGGPVLTPWRGRVAGIVEAWYPGSAGGTALARVLFGDVDPGGRLPATFPRREADLPTAGSPRRYPGVGGTVHYDEGVLVGYRWFDQGRLRPAFPFGFGLSYSRFALRDLHVRRTGRGASVSLTVRNTGARPGVAVPQLYLGLPGARGRVQPPRQLKDFARVALRPHRSRHVRLHLSARDFSYWDVERHGWRIAPGCYRIEVGSSSRDIALRRRICR